MKNLKLGLRVWIAVTSLLSFLGGWAILSHADKPAALFADQTITLPDPIEQSQALLPPLEPIPSLEDLTVAGSLQPLPSLSSAPRVAANNNSVAAAPRLRTRGS
jgi:hypothetical protein